MQSRGSLHFYGSKMFGRQNKPFAKAIGLQEWQDPVDDVVAVFSERSCDVYFFIRESEKIGKLSFEAAWAFRSVKTECAPYMDRESTLHSYVLEVFNSPWPSEIEFGFYTESSKARLHSEAKHFLVQGHDIYHEVLCRGYTEKYLMKSDGEYSYARRLLGAVP